VVAQISRNDEATATTMSALQKVRDMTRIVRIDAASGVTNGASTTSVADKCR
jgi:hypothetical protein